jgi:competence ComEA-like helix-hairpin-helix protein
MSYYCRHDKISVLGGLVLFTVAALAKFIIVYPVLFAVIVVGVGIPAVFIARFLLDLDNRQSISDVPSYYVKGTNTISNTHCTVKYVPDDKIIVMDNVADTRNKKRMFTKQVQSKYKLNRYWADTCRVFDDMSSVDSLSNFLDVSKMDIVIIDAGVRNSKVEKSKYNPNKKVVNIDSSSVGAKLVDIKNVEPDAFGFAPESYGKDKPEEFVNMNSLSEQKQTAQSAQNEDSFFVDFSDALHADSKKIAINSVSATELSVLPGINIVKAKKIIEYRDTNGYFKTVDAFLNVAEVKDYFAEKIKGLIDVSIPKEIENNDDDGDNGGRIVDF